MTDLKKCGHQGLNLLNATDAAKQISAGKITSEQLVTDCLQRIQERDPRIGAWKFLDPAQALAQARACDNGERTGPLLGVPVGIKDNFDTKDMPTEYGTAVYQGHRPKTECCGTPTGGRSYPRQNGDIRVRGALSRPNVKPA